MLSLCQMKQKPNLSHQQVTRVYPERLHRAPVYGKIFSFLCIPCVIVSQWQTFKTDVHNQQSHNSQLVSLDAFVLTCSYCLKSGFQVKFTTCIHCLLNSPRACLGNLASIPGENLCFFQNLNMSLATQSNSFLLDCFPLQLL